MSFEFVKWEWENKTKMKYIAFTVKGLESIAAGEIKGRILAQGTKRIIFDSDDETNVRKLRTVDDVGYFIGSGKIKNEQEIINLVYSQDLARVKPTNGFSLTLSFAGAGGIDKVALTKQLILTIQNKYHWQHLDRDHSRFDLRLFLDKEDLFLSVRVTEKPLFHREYRKVSIKGALRPTIAAAMVRWASRDKTGLRLVDNFCGSGTILAEAKWFSHQICGGDIDPEAVNAARRNLPNTEIRQQDALKTNWPSQHFELAVSNLPWDKQIKIDSVTQLYQGTLQEYGRIVKPGGVICLLVAKPELLVKLAKGIFGSPAVKTLPLGYLGQNPTIVLIPVDSRRGRA